MLISTTHSASAARRRRSAVVSAEVARYSLGLLLGLLGSMALGAEDSWEAALSQMPLEQTVMQLNRTNCVEVMLRAFRSNQVVKALIFMPGATDEFYMFRRARAELTNARPTLLDAVNALTNQTFIRATFEPPMLLLHTGEDFPQPLIDIQHPATAEKLKLVRFIPHVLYDDRDWDVLQPALKKQLKVDILPWRYSYDSWHFYRHSFAAWGLTGWEALEAAARAGKSVFAVRRHSVIFLPDQRAGAAPKLDAFPK